MTEEIDELEKEFIHLMDSVGKQIDAKVKIAEQAMKEAVELSKKFGIPFTSRVSSIANNYISESFREKKFSEINRKKVVDLIEVNSYSLNKIYGGWEHSKIC